VCALALYGELLTMTLDADNWSSQGDAVSISDYRQDGGPSFDPLGLLSESRELLRSSANSNTASSLPMLTIEGLEPNQTDVPNPVAPPGDAPAAPVAEQAPAQAPAVDKPEITYDANGIPIQRIDFGRNLTGITTDYDTAGNIARVSSLKENNTIEVTDFTPNQTVTTIYDFTNNTISGTVLNNRDGSITPFNFVPPAGQGIPRPQPYVRQ